MTRAKATMLSSDFFGHEYEERLLELCASGNLDLPSWQAAGPGFFMAGLATMLASAAGFDRRAYLALAESLHAGITRVDSFSEWLARSPLRPERFLPSLRIKIAYRIAREAAAQATTKSRRR